MRRSVVLLSTLLMFFSVSLASQLYAADSLAVVNVTGKRVQLSATMGIEQVRYFTLDSPKRLVVDLYGVLPGGHEAEIQLSDGFQRLRVGPFENKTRFVFDVSGALFPVFKVNTDNDQVVVTWEPSQNAAEAALAEPLTAGSAKITAINFAAEKGQSKIYINLTGKAETSPLVKDGNKVQFVLKNTTLPQSLRRIFDTLAFPSAIHSVTPYLVDATGQPEVRFIVLLKGEVPYRLQRNGTGYEFVVDDKNYAQVAQPATGTLPISAQGGVVITSGSTPIQTSAVVAETSQPKGGQIEIPFIEQVGTKGAAYTGAKTTLVFDNAEVRVILRLLAETGEFNLIASDQVKGNISLRLIDVPWDQAFALILDVTGLGKIHEGNVVRVLPKETIRAMREAELTADRSQEEKGALVTEHFYISYAALKDVSGPCRNLLSERGKITEDSRNKMLIVTDVPTMFEGIKDLIHVLDTPIRQVMIEARIVEVNSHYSRDLGVNWGYTHTPSDYLANVTNAGGGFQVNTSTVGAVGEMGASAGLGSAFRIGESVLDIGTLDIQISALESDGNGKVISTPRVTTLNSKPAVISQGTSIPYQSQDDDGTKTEFVDAELKLEVTPVINADGTILLDILATNDSPSFTPLAGAPSIDTKKVETNVLVKDGETTVIGGIFVESIIDSEDGIPGLMDIPLLGNLFKSQNKQVIKNELLIFITPRIVNNE